MSSEKRSYELRERAKRQAATRQRIIAATAALHEEVGPAATTVADIARRAGVSRLTVYNHFPSDSELFAACQQLFLDENPLPDLRDALALADPLERVRAVLSLLYPAFRGQAPMSSKVLHDRRALPALDALLARTRDANIAGLAKALVGGFNAKGTSRRRLSALIALALDFWTWERLTQQGLSDRRAAALMADLVRSEAARSTGA